MRATTIARNYAEALLVVLGKAFTGKLPKSMVRFLQKLVLNRRQMLLPQIAIEYGNLVDETSNRVHAQVTLSREVSESDRNVIAAQLTRAFAKTVVPHMDVNPAIL